MAFTLAEVLITLGIIGVVAAMTMPTLVANYQEKALISQFKKTYSNLQNTINLINVENGASYECYYLKGDKYYTSQCNQFYDELFKKLRIISHCSPRDTNCRVKYKTKEQVIADDGKCLNQNCSYHIAGSEAYYLSDGSILYVLSVAESGFNNMGAVFIGLDINGKKGPNRWGYDLFYLNFLKKDITANITALTALCELVEKGGQSAEEMMLK